MGMVWKPRSYREYTVCLICSKSAICVWFKSRSSLKSRSRWKYIKTPCKLGLELFDTIDFNLKGGYNDDISTDKY